MMMKLVGASRLLFVVGSALQIVHAVKDDEYYRAGMGNPNVDLKMYWADAHNVLEDLDQFSTLYVQFHHCAWSQNRDHYNGEEEEGHSADENDYWYMGATPSFAANVAYSLYGSLKGESFSGCNANTFINSFTTNSGFEAFAQSMYSASALATDYSQKYSSACQGGAGVACDYNLGFAYVSFSTDTCDPSYAKAVKDNMGYMNSDFQSMQCVKIYDASKDSYSSYGGGYGNANYYGGYSGGYGYNSYSYYYQYSGTPLSLLYYSNACFVQNFWAPNGGCPDPYGKLQMYQQNFNKGVRKSLKVDPYVTYRANMEKGKKLVKMGAALFMAAALIYLCEQLLAVRKKARPKILQGTPPTQDKHRAGGEPIAKKRSRSFVALVQKGAGRAKNAVKSTVAAVVSAGSKCDDSSFVNDLERLEGDGILKDQEKVGGSSYKAPPSQPESVTAIPSDSMNSVVQDMPKSKKSEEQFGQPVSQCSSDESAVKVDHPDEEYDSKKSSGMLKLFGKKN
jgi:hypothetical protein